MDIAWLGMPEAFSLASFHAVHPSGECTRLRISIPNHRQVTPELERILSV